MKEKNDHRSKFSNLSNWKEEDWKNQGFILHFDLQTQFKYMNYFIYTSRHLTPHGRYELNKLTSLPMCGFTAQLVDHRTGIAESRVPIPLKPWFFQASSFQLFKLEHLLRWSFFTFNISTIDRFHSGGQESYKFIRTKEFNSHREWFGTPIWLSFIALAV